MSVNLFFEKFFILFILINLIHIIYIQGKFNQFFNLNFNLIITYLSLSIIYFSLFLYSEFSNLSLEFYDYNFIFSNLGLNQNLKYFFLSCIIILNIIFLNLVKRTIQSYLNYDFFIIFLFLILGC